MQPKFKEEWVVKVGKEAFTLSGEQMAVLREAMKNDIPTPILKRKEKIGFGAPQHLWFREEFIYKKIEDSLHDHKHDIECFFDYQGVYNQLILHKSGKQDYSNNIWKLYNFILWLEKHF